MIKKLFSGNKKSLYMIILGVVLVCMTLGVSLLTSTLTIKGNSTIKKSSWVIYFDDIEIAEDSAKNEDSRDDAKIAKNGAADLTKENIEFTANLKNPGDFYEFTVYTVNDGTIDAEVESVEKSLLSEEQQKYLEFEVKYDDGEEIKRCDVLQAGTRRLVKAVVKFKDGLDISDYPSDPITLNLFFKINYSQNVSCPVCEGESCVVKHKLTIRPNGGTYEGRTAARREYLKTEDTYTLKTPTRRLYNFIGWRVIDPETGGTYTFDDETFLFTMGSEDVIIEAQWEEGDYVARIMDKYYHTIQEAFDDASKDWEDNTVWLLKNTTEYPTNNTRKPFAFNLDGYTVKGRITNSKDGNITLLNGKIEGLQEEGTTGNGEGVRNYGTLTLGVNDNNVQVENSIVVTGDTYGVYNVQGSKFNFYDGYIEAKYAMAGIKSEMTNGSIEVAPRHFIITDHKNVEDKEYERVYLTPNPNRAVAKTTTIIETYYYNLQDAINDVVKTKATQETTDNDYIIYAIRNFEAAHPIEVPENSRIFFDLSGYNVQTGESVTNNGYFKIYNSKSGITPTISVSKTITNNGSLDVSDVKLKSTADVDIIDTKGNLKLTNVEMQATNKYCVKNTDEGTLDFNGNILLKADDEYALYNSSNNANIKTGTIYGLYNTGNIVLDGEDINLIVIKQKNTYDTYTRALYNDGTVTMNGGNITTNINVGMIVNRGTFNYNDGLVHSEYTAIENSGTVNVNDNEITSTRTAISGGTVNVKGTVSSVNGPAISSATTNVNGGVVTSSNGYAISGGTTYVNSGEVYSDTTISIDNGRYGSTIVQGGTVRSETTAVSGGSLTVKSGTVTGENYAANVSSFTINGGEVTSPNIAVNTTNATVTGGLVEGKTSGIVTDNLTMSEGNVKSTDGIGITINNTGLITGGEVSGGTYGVLSKNELTLGTDDEDITSETPVLKGESYGLYITGSTTNFYDGILKGQVDGYNAETGEITGTPLGGVVLDGEEEIEGVHYETDFISRFENWLRIGETEYNTLNAASNAASDGDVIVVTKDAEIKFKQSVLGSDKNLKLDLNGHKVTTTQTITNEAKLEIIDTSESEEKEYDVGEYQGTLEFTKNTGILNVNELTLNGGLYTTEKAEFLIENKQTLVINKADMYTTKNAMYNNYNSYNHYYANMTINDINIISSYNGINGTGTNALGGNDWIQMNGGIIRATNNGIGEGIVEMNGGEIIAGNNGIYGDKNNVYLNNDSKITATNGYAVYRGEASVTINGGEYTSLNNIGIEAHTDINMNGGKVTGTTGLKNGYWWTGYVYIDGPITMNGGEVVGTVNDGINIVDNTLYFYGGVTKGARYGINNNSSTRIGKNDGVISKTAPVAIGDVYGVYTNGNSTHFFDGILKGKAIDPNDDEEENRGHYGLIELIPDASMIENGYEYIDRQKYHTQYIETLGDWLEVNGNTYNSINAAQAAIENEGTITVIRDAYVNFDQTMPQNKKITFNLNGHSVMVTRTISSQGDNTFIDELGNDAGEGNGMLNGINTIPISVGGTSVIKGGTYYSQTHSGISTNGTTTIEGGTFKSDNTNSINNNGTINFKDGEVISEKTYAVLNSGTFNMISGEIKAYGGINGGTINVEGGRIEGTNTNSINSGGTVVVNDGEVYNERYVAINKGTSGKVTVNGGLIKSDGAQAISLDSYTYGHASGEINGGEIIGATNGITTESCPLVVNGGHIVGTANNGLNVRGTTTILGGVIEGGVYGVYSTGTTTLGENDRVISIDLPVLKGESYGLYIGDGSTLDFYDGILKGTIGRYEGQVRNIPDGSEILYDEEQIDGKQYLTAYLRGESDFIINLRTETIYSNLQIAIDEASDGDTLKVLDTFIEHGEEKPITTIPIYYEVTNEKNLTIDMNGKTITTNKKITNRGNLKIINTSNNEAIIKTSTPMELITNTGNLEIEKITLRNNSSSNYIINNTNELKLENSKVDGINCINSNSKLTIETSEIKGTNRGINNTGILTINGGKYTGSNYSIYSSTNGEVNITNAVLNGTYYNGGANNTNFIDSILNGSLQNNRSTMNITGTEIEQREVEGKVEKVYKAQINGAVSNSNSGTLTIEKSKINVGTSNFTNNSTVRINNSEYRGISTSYYYLEYASISNSGLMEITNTNLYDCTDGGNYSPVGIENSGTLNLTDSNLYVGKKGISLSTIKGIKNNGSGNVTLENSNIYIDGGSSGYGIYSNSTGAQTTIKTGNIEVTNTSTGYGAYISQGTFTMGVNETLENEHNTVEVSQENPRIYVQGTSRGIGVKKLNGNFNFYDGVIWASKYTKPETTTNVQTNYEVTTYVDEETGFEYAWLEPMEDDYMHSDAVAKIGETFYPTVQAALDRVEAGEEIILLKSTQEEKLTIPSGTIAKLNLNSHSITAQVENNGILQVYNGSLQSFEETEEVTTVVNNGTLIMGEDDGKVSSTNVRIVSENKAVENNGTFIMYDGYLEGNPAKTGEIDEIAEFARLYTTKDTQSERIFLQSLSEESIKNKETALILTIDPNSGLYDNDKKIKTEYVYYEDIYELKVPTKNGCVFVGWEVNVDGVLEGNTVTVGTSDITLKAKWEVSEDAVAKIGEEYYTTLVDAIYHANNKDLIELFKDVEEDITVDKEITIDLGGNTVTGEFINLGILRLLNGTIENPDGIGILNRKTLTLGENDGEIETEGVKIIGTTIGIQQEGRLNFYDGYIEGEVALNGSVASVPKGYYLYNEHNSVKDCQRVYLIGNPANAVAVTTEGGTQYFFSLQDAIDTAAITGNEIFIVRDFEASYPIEVKEDTNILINMNSYNITTGNTITNNGTLKIYDSSEDKGSITTATTITNNGDMTIDGISIIEQNTSNTTISNASSGTLTINNAYIEAKNNYAINSEGKLNLTGDFNITSTSNYALRNVGNKLVLNSGTIKGLTTNKDVEINDGSTLEASKNDTAALAVSSSASVVVNGGSLTSTGNNAIYTSGTNNVTINGGTLKGNTGIYCNAGTSNYIINGGVIETTNIGVRLQGANCNLEMNAGSITSTNQGIYIYNTPHTITINDGEITSKNNSGIQGDYGSSTLSTLTVNGGTITGGTYGAYLYGTKIIMNGGELKTTSTNRDYYALDLASYSGAEINEGSIINAPKASGIWVTNDITLTGASVYAGASNAYGIYTNGSNITINEGTTIAAPGASSVGIQLADNGYNPTITINGGEVNSGNIGIHTASTNSTRTININDGKISGENYGIYQINTGSVINIGLNSEELSTSIPYVTGGLYGIYHTSGTMNFYNGRLRGYTYGYNSNFDNVRSEMDIVEEVETDSQYTGIRTMSTTNVSNEPISNYAKAGNGYARITYVGEDDVCSNGDTYEFDYKGYEETFVTPCTGKYKLEVWGAQGGGNSITAQVANRAGAGGYSTGTINLLSGDTLYINVGGAGSLGNHVAGGYNGGGASGDSGAGGSGSGGGATHIATSSGLLSTLENNKNSVIIVAGGGGGTDDVNNGNYNSSDDGSGGSGGGYRGNYAIISGAKNTSYNPGTQDSGYKFGQGQDVSSCDSGGAGAGWYGGYATNNCSGGGTGGSGYIGNTKLYDKYMYGYNVQTPPSQWINNYLVEKEDFLQVGDQTFNSINKAQAAIEENGTGTIIVIKDAEINEVSTIEANKNITFDLNGHTLTMSQPITNKANLSVVDSGQEKGVINNSKSNIFINEKDITLDGVHLNAPGRTAIVGQTSTGTITVNNSTIEGANCISATSTMIIDVKDSTLLGSDNGIYSNASNSKINVENTSILARESSLYAGIYLDSNTKQDLTIKDSTITATNFGIRTYSSSDSIINVIDCNITSTGDTALSSERYGTVNVTGGKMTGYNQGIINRDSTLTLENVEVSNTRADRGYYALYNNKNATINDGTIIKSPSASGVYNSSILNINGGEIFSEASNGYGVYSYGTLNMNGGKITTVGNSSYGIINDDSWGSSTINIYGGEIESQNVGIYIYASRSNYAKVINAYGGKITGKTYGIQQNGDYVTTTLGNKNEELTLEAPIVKGGTYGVYAPSGVANFYSGKLSGTKYGYYATFNDLRLKKQIYTEYEIFDENNPLTISTQNISETPTSEYAKIGNGYARITYVGETTESCTNGQVFNFDYTGDEQTFSAPCIGNYKLEIWGAQGGQSLCGGEICTAGGYGGYASGNITLEENEVLYINVGGTGSNGSLTSCAQGGYNGGGQGTNDGGGCSTASDDEGASGGGGATHIATSSGLLKDLSNDKDSVIIVAGGGGGASYTFTAGSGGGFKGGTTDYTSKTVVNQSSGYSFGQGQNGTGAGASDGVAGGGGGYYGGFANNVDGKSSGSGGSGYISNDRLQSGVMYGYQVDSTVYVINYLVEKDAFLEVNGVYYNSLQDAIDSIEDTGTINVINNSTVNDSSLIPEGKTITLDLNGHTLTATQSITNKGDLTVIDSASEKGMINNIKNTCIINEKNVTANGVYLKSSNSAAIAGQTSTGTITVNNSTIEGVNGIRATSTMTINVKDSTLSGSDNGIYSNAANSKVNVENTTITARESSLYAGIYLDSNTKQDLTIKDSTITATNFGIRTYSSSDSIINVIDCNITSTDDTALSSERYGTVNVTGGKMTGYNQGIINRDSSLTLENVEVTNARVDRGYYALYNTKNATINDGTVIKSSNASGVYNSSTLNINGGEIYSGTSNGYGVYNYGTLNMNGGKITTVGSSSYGITNSDDWGSSTINVNGGEIESFNVGIYIYASRSSYKKVINAYGGKITGKTYGIQQSGAYTTTNLGNAAKSVSITEPYIEGGVYSIYETDGIINFYSGILKGYTKAYSADFNTIREGYEIYEENGEASTYLVNHKTYSAETSSENAISETAKEGNGYARITYTGTSTVKQTHKTKEELNCEELIGKEYLFGYQGKAEKFVPECAGKYKIELWGAQGGTVAGIEGGKGAYTSGEISLTSKDNLYVYVGESYSEYKETASYNGGGHGSYSSRGNDKNGNGGGATDVRLVSGDWNNFESLKSRIMVAAGGGGANNYTGTGSQGGYGGALIGGSGNNMTSSAPADIVLASGGTQTSGGLYAGADPQPGTANLNGQFGMGGYGNSYYIYGNVYNAGGGGGYYGGGAGGSVYANVGSAAGGSSFISGYDGCDAVSEESTSDNIIHTGQSIHYSNYKFDNGVMIAGNGLMPTHTGTSLMTGNSGYGYAKITFIELDDVSTVEYVTDYGTLAQSKVQYNTGEQIGTLPIPTLSNNDMIFDGWYLDVDYNNKIDEEYVVKGDTKLFAKFIYSTDTCSLTENTVYEFDYTGDKQEFNAQCTGNYKLEIWGAQGGNASYNSISYIGGYGGYVSGDITLLKDEKLYIYVGGQGESIDYQQSQGTYTFDESTGYNGGGYASYSTNNSSHGGGGGATHIATTPGLLKDLSTKRESIIMVAGGGGGASAHKNSPSYSGNGGVGGGLMGGDGQTANTTCYNYGTGGTQGETGTYKACANDGHTWRDSAPSNPNFGLGSNYSSNSTGNPYGGGGGGYYGGQSGYHAPGGGGSGYNYNPRVTNNTMYAYKLTQLNLDDPTVAYLVKAHEFIINEQTGKKYTNLQEAITEASDEETIKLISDGNISYNVTVPNKTLVFDLNGYNILISKTLTNNGNLTITNSNTEKTSRLYSNIGVTVLLNNSELNINNSEISSDSIAVNNTGKITINNSKLSGTTYALYDNSTLDTNITDSNLTSSNTAYYKNSTGTTTILDTDITGVVNNNNATGKMNITNKTINGQIVNKGNATIKNVTISKSMSNYDHEQLIENSGVMTLTNNNVTLTSTYTRGSTYDSRAVYNSGTLTSSRNNYIVTNSNKEKHLIGLYNNGLLTADNDTVNISNSRYGYGIYNSSSNTATLSNMTITVSNGREYDYAIYNNSGVLTVEDSSVEMFNSSESKGLYVNESGADTTTTNTTYNLHDNNISYGTYMNNGNLTIVSGTFNSLATTTAFGNRVVNGTILVNNVTFDINAATSTGVSMSDGTVTLEHGSYTINGTNTYGVNMTRGELTLGVYDGRGTDAADVSTTDPYIYSIGTTSGIGISMGSGTFNFYDGYFSGSTLPRPTGDITSSTEKNYELKEYTDENTGYKYCILEYTR